MIKCGECGYENMDGLDYCDGCGAKLNAAAAPEHAGAGAGGSGASAPAASAAPSAEAAAAAAPAAESTPAAAHTDGGAAADGGTVATGPATAGTVNSSTSSEGAPSSEAPTGEIQKPAEAPPAAEPQPAAAAATFKAKLSILRGGRKGQEFELEAGNNQIGRWDPETGAFPEVDLDQDDPEAKVSRKHALVRIDGGKLTVEDTGSLNGTYVNRQPRLIPGTPVELKNGDEIIIGKTFLRLVIEPIS
jgi:pSer/pThr/pTyr-binding forkhead associated (FHA) protein